MNDELTMFDVAPIRKFLGEEAAKAACQDMATHGYSFVRLSAQGFATHIPAKNVFQTYEDAEDD